MHDKDKKSEVPVAQSKPTTAKAFVKAAKLVEKVEPEQMISFDRYFTVLGRPSRHKKGMIAFLKSIKGRKTKAEWDRLFQGY